jgi:polar amino acid transport system substrate-binding protein
MASFNELFQKSSEQILKYRKGLLIGLGTLLVLMLFMRACSSSDFDKTRVYQIARDPRWTALNLMGKERNMTAFSDDLLVAIAKEEQLRLSVIGVNSDELISRLERKEYDAILSSTYPSSHLQDLFAFSDPYFLIGPVLIVSIDSELDSSEELSNKIIGIQRGSPLLLQAKRYPNIQLRPYDTTLQALAELDSGAIDGVLEFAFPAYTYIRSFYPSTLKVSSSPLNDEGLRLITLKNEMGENLIETFNEGLRKIKENGTYERLIQEWGLINAEKPTANG